MWSKISEPAIAEILVGLTNTLTNIIIHVYVLAECLHCYKCSLRVRTRRVNETVLPCTNFDGSAHYIVECPYSTMCMKQTVTLTLQDGGKYLHDDLETGLDQPVFLG